MLPGLIFWTWSIFHIALFHYCITFTPYPTVMCASMCVVHCLYPIVRFISLASHGHSPPSLAACSSGASNRDLLSAKARARFRDGGEAYHWPVLYLDWQMNGSFARAPFTICGNHASNAHVNTGAERPAALAFSASVLDRHQSNNVTFMFEIRGETLLIKQIRQSHCVSSQMQEDDI